MEPVISHRCPKCGASIRVGAKFCAQCGAEGNQPLPTGTVQDVAAVVETNGGADEMPTTRGSNAPTQPFRPDARELPFVVESPVEEEEISVQEVAAPVPTTKTKVTRYASHSKTQRVKNAARDMVQENVRPGVEKLRRASSVVFEEASAIDPSLRFILIAIVLFIFFLLLLLLSFVK